MITIDARKDACPIPVVKTKNALRQLHGPGEVRTLVDNEIAVQNITKMAVQMGWKVRSEKAGRDYAVTVTADGEETSRKEQEEPSLASCSMPEEKTIVVISSECVGSGNDELGHILMKSFLFALTQQDELPGTLIFYNTGAKLTCEDSPVLEDIRTLESLGVEILTCGTCLDFQHLKEKLAAGSVTNMYDIAERMLKADRIVRP